MKNRKDILIDLLSNQSQPVSSVFLASKMNISVNTVKRLVKAINSEYPNRIIQSSHSGYKLIRNLHPSSKEQNEVPQNYLERSFYIIKEILLNDSSGDIYDMAEDLCISYSTLKATLQKMNKTFENFHVVFLCKQDRISITGSEENLRRLAVYVISEETNWQFIDLESLRKIFGENTVDATVTLVRSAFKKNQCQLTDFAFMNLILHLLIFIERCLQGNHLPIPLSIDYHSIVEQQPDNYRHLFLDICKNLHQAFELNMSDGDRYEICIILQSNISHTNLETTDEALATIGKDMWHRIYKITTTVCELCKVNLVNDYFLPNFFLHVNKLITSNANNIYSRNPLLNTIKNECRLIYDIALLFSIQISEEFGITVTDDETGYLALHIASEISRQSSNENKLQVILFCPDYRYLQSQLKNELTQTLGQDIYIKKTVSRIEELKGESYDLILTTVDLSLSDSCNIIKISPFGDANRRGSLLQQILSFKYTAKKKFLLENFNQVFRNDLFFINPGISTRDELIHSLCEKMLRLELTPQNFEQTVLVRENAASTAFSKIAIPHSIRMNALKTSIAIVISNNDISWGDTTVNLVLLFAVNYVDRSNFSKIYESLLSFLDNPEFLMQIRQVQTLGEFKRIIESGFNMEKPFIISNE